MLHEPIKDVKRAWCGPTAISSIAQQPISKIEKMTRRVRADSERKRYGRVLKGGNAVTPTGKRKKVNSMWPGELIEVMRRLKFKLVERKSFNGTLRAFCDDYGHSGPFIVFTNGHFLAVSKGMLCDTLTKKPIPMHEYPHPNCRMKEYLKFA